MDIEMQNHQHQQQQMNEFQAMLDAATAAASSSNSNSTNGSGQGQQEGYDTTAMQANLLQQQVCRYSLYIPFLSLPLTLRHSLLPLLTATARTHPHAIANDLW
jgi:hypothetical protein